MALWSSRHRLSPAQIGGLAAVLFLVFGVLLFQKTKLTVMLSSGDTVRMELARNYKLKADITTVKVAGVPAGVVTGAHRHGDGARVDLKLHKGLLRTLGSAPSAAVRPTTVLGGNYYVELTPGGTVGAAPAGAIPVSRTTVPVELDSVVGMITGDARTALQHDVGTVNSTFSGAAKQSLQNFAATAPAAMQSDAALLAALEGTHPSSDLTDVVSGLESTTKQLAANSGAFNDDIAGLATLSRTLDAQSGAISATIAEAPATLRSTQQGLTDLQTVLSRLRTTSKDALPSVRALTRVLADGQGDLRTIAPVVHDLRPLMDDLDPDLATAVPTATNATAVVGDVRSPVIDRISGPIINTLEGPVHGAGSATTYQQVAYMFSVLNRNSMTTDHNGAMINFQPGPGPDTLTEFGPGGIMTALRNLILGTPGAAR